MPCNPVSLPSLLVLRPPRLRTPVTGRWPGTGRTRDGEIGPTPRPLCMWSVVPPEAAWMHRNWPPSIIAPRPKRSGHRSAGFWFAGRNSAYSGADASQNRTPKRDGTLIMPVVTGQHMLVVVYATRTSVSGRGSATKQKRRTSREPRPDLFRLCGSISLLLTKIRKTDPQQATPCVYREPPLANALIRSSG